MPLLTLTRISQVQFLYQKFRGGVDFNLGACRLPEVRRRLMRGGNVEEQGGLLKFGC